MRGCDDHTIESLLELHLGQILEKSIAFSVFQYPLERGGQIACQVVEGGGCRRGRGEGESLKEIYIGMRSGDDGYVEFGAVVVIHRGGSLGMLA